MAREMRAFEVVDTYVVLRNKRADSSSECAGDHFSSLHLLAAHCSVGPQDPPFLAAAPVEEGAPLLRAPEVFAT
eukprot:3118535-Alexandrium_andersonii.AAC.1